jgi:hypothetical protein
VSPVKCELGFYIPEDGILPSHRRQKHNSYTLACPVLPIYLSGYSSQLNSYTILSSVCRLLVRANVPSSPIIITLMKEALRSSETSALTRATRRNIPEDAIFHSHLRENLKSYIDATCYISPRFQSVLNVVSLHRIGSIIHSRILTYLRVT